MKNFIVVVCLSLFSALFVVGCGSSAGTSSNGNSAPTSSTPASTPSSTASTGSIGVPACDEYLTKMETCLNSKNVPESVKDAYRKSFEQYRDAWKKASADPNGRAALEQGCKAAVEGAKTFFDSCK